MKNVSEKIARVLTPYNIQVIHKPTQKLASFFGLRKDPISPLDNCGVVYEIACADCDKVYVGQTKNSLRTRVKQHEAALRLLQCEKSAVAEHAYNNQHRIAWKESKVLCRQRHQSKRLFAEAWCTKQRVTSSLNRCDLSIPAAYAPLISK